MAGPVELVIVAGVFGIVGIYLYIVSRFIRAAEAETPNVSSKTPADANRPPVRGLSTRSEIAAH